MYKILTPLLLVLLLSSCSVTEVLMAPVRLVGDVVSLVPVVGPMVDGVIQGTADAAELAAD